MGIPVENHRRQAALFTTILAMMVTLFVSRAALSISIIFFLGAALLHKNIGVQLRNFFKTPWLLGMAALFVLPFLSGLWSTDLNEWRDLVRIKLPLLLLPIAFAGTWQLTAGQWLAAALVFILIVLGGTVWSFEKYWMDQQATSESYLRAKVFQTPLQNDHVRFSWLVAVAALLCVWLVENIQHRLKWIALLTGVWLAIYLHVLAARTGLFSLYLMLLCYAVWKLFKVKNKALVAGVGLVVLALPVLAWLFLPTFQNRIKYFRYDYSFIRNGTYLPGGNDGNRMLSYRAGWHVLKTHPFGAGAGDVFTETNNWYNAHVPNMLESDKLYPSSEWLLYGGSAGWVGVVLFTAAMLLPFRYPPSAHLFYWYSLCGTAACSFLFDIGLEVQYGVFTYAFLLLWWWKWFSLTPETHRV
jgi:O-antigen ligase